MNQARFPVKSSTHWFGPRPCPSSALYGISDVGLAKTCQRHEIPYPSRGYWARVRNGQKVKKRPLPHVDDPQLQNVPLTKLPPAAIAAAAKAAATAPAPEDQIVVAVALSDPHPLVERTVRSLNNGHPNDRGLVKPRASKCLDVEVSPAAIDRAARILDTLLKATERRSWPVIAGDGDALRTVVSVGEQQISLRLEELVERQEQTKSFLEHQRDYRMVPTGKLAIHIDCSESWGFRKKWSDGRRTLEVQLNAVIHGIEAAAQAVQAHREECARRERERQAEQHREAEAARRRAEEEARAFDFEQKLAHWEQAQRIRAFIAAVRERALQCGVDLTPGTETARWHEWALRRADAVDPLIAARAEDRWPPPAGYLVQVPARQPEWSSYRYGGTAVTPP